MYLVGVAEILIIIPLSRSSTIGLDSMKAENKLSIPYRYRPFGYPLFRSGIKISAIGSISVINMLSGWLKLLFSACLNIIILSPSYLKVLLI